MSYHQRGHIFIESVFCLFFIRNSPKFYTRDSAVKRRSCLSYIHSRQRGGISIRRGSGLFISCRAFGDASNKINRNNVLRFLFIYNNFITDHRSFQVQNVNKISFVNLLTHIALCANIKQKGGRIYEKDFNSIARVARISPALFARRGDSISLCF